MSEIAALLASYAAKSPRYIVALGGHRGMHPHGAPTSVTLYKTLNGALNNTRWWTEHSSSPSAVLLLDLAQLPAVMVDPGALHADRQRDEFMFAERQMVLWAERAATLARDRR